MGSHEWHGWSDMVLEGERLKDQRQRSLEKRCVDGPLRMCTECEYICVPHEFYQAPTGSQVDKMVRFVRSDSPSASPSVCSVACEQSGHGDQVESLA